MLKTISIYHLITEKAPIEASASVSMAFTKSTALKERETPTAAPIPMKGFFDGAVVFVGTTTFTAPLGRLLLKQQFLHQSLFLPRRVPVKGVVVDVFDHVSAILSTPQKEATPTIASQA